MSVRKRKGRRGGHITAEMCRAHARKRLWERYHIDASDELIQRIETCIRMGSGNTWRLFNQYWAKSVWRVAYANQVYFVVYDEYLKCALTFLTKEWVMKRRPSLIC